MEYLFLGTLTTVVAGTIYWCWYRKPEEEQIQLNVLSLQIPQKAKKESSHKNDNGIPMKILYYSQTGTAEDFAQRLSEDLSSFGFSPETIDVENYDREEFQNEKLVVFLASTYGEGDPPDNASEFHQWLMAPERAEEDLKLSFAVFGLGNKTYDRFNQVGKEIDGALERIGGKRLFALGLGDDDVNIEKDFLSWKKELGAVLCKEYDLDAPVRAHSAPGLRRQKLVTYKPEDNILKGVDINTISRWRQDEKPRSAPDIKNPFLAQILVTRELHTPKSDRSCLHVEISTHGDVLSYLPGDHLGLYPENDPTMVHKLAALLKADLNTIVSIHTVDDKSETNPLVGPCTLKAALSQYYDITSIVRKPQLRMLAQYAKEEEEKARLIKLSSEDPESQEVYDAWVVHDCRCISEVLKEFKSVEVPLDHFFEVLPKMQPRYYSISSSPNKYPNSVHLTAVLVDYVTPTKRHARGVTTLWLSTHRAEPEKNIFPRIPAFIRRSNFKLPSSISTPIIMVGPGTGLAPFRGFIQDCNYRRANNPEVKPGELILFFGCRHPEKDYIYQEELEGYEKDGTLSRLVVAFSRLDENKKVYVQDKMKESDIPDQIWRLLESGAHFYICGDARLMARDVSETLLNIIMEKGSRSREEAQKYVDELQNSQRHLSDVWS